MPRVLVVSGLRCSGKETTRKYLIEKGAYQDGIDVSDDILRPVAQEREITRIADLLPLYLELGTKYFFDRIKQKVESTDGKVVVSSVRELALYERLKERYGENLALLYLRAKPEIRFQRRQARKRAGDMETFEEFRLFEAKEVKAYDMVGLIGGG
ncbi:MAG TPA: AAA family ATPase, partial [archaeon]|nr:AAA family ATPase [archaeon]